MLLLLLLQLQLLQLDLALMQLWQGEWRLLLLSDYVIAVGFSVFFLFSFTFVCDEKRFVFVLTQLSRPRCPSTHRRLCVLSECCASREFVAISHCQRTRSPVNFD